MTNAGSSSGIQWPLFVGHDVAPPVRAGGERILLPQTIRARVGRGDGDERQIAVAAGAASSVSRELVRDGFDLAAERLEERGSRPERRSGAAPRAAACASAPGSPHRPRRAPPRLVKRTIQRAVCSAPAPASAATSVATPKRASARRAGTSGRRDRSCTCSFGRRSDPVFRMRGIDQDERRDVSAIALREDAHDEAAERVADEHERRRHAGASEQHVQLVGDAAGRARHRPGIAPAESGAIVAAGARQTRDLRLHERPADRRGAQRRVEDDGRFTVAGAVEVQTKSRRRR